MTLHPSRDLGATRLGTSLTKADVTGADDDLLPHNDVCLLPVGDTATLRADHEVEGWKTEPGASLEWARSNAQKTSSATVFYAPPLTR